MSNTAIRIGVVGAGDTTVNGHIPRFRAIDGVEVVAVANRTIESGRRVADSLGIPKVYASWTDLLDDPTIGAVCVGTWPYMHRSIVLTALERGKHVMIEARMARSTAEAHDMLRASLAHPHLVAQVVPPNILDLNVTGKIIDMIAGGFLGEVLSANFALNGGLMAKQPPFTWRHDRDFSGYNTMMLGAWYEHLMRILGPATSVTATTRLVSPMRYDESERGRFTTIPDHVEVLCEMSGRALLHMRISDVTGLAPPGRLWIYGTEGALRCDFEPDADHNETKAAWLWAVRKGETELTEIDVPFEKGANVREEQEFIDAIRGIAPISKTTFADGVKYMEFTEAVTRSAQERVTVGLPL